MRPESFLRGAFILTVSALVVKVLGAVYRIPFTRLVGSEGIGLYQMAYPVYTTLLALSTSGIPLAISLLVAERKALGDHAGARQVFWLSLGLLLALGLLLSGGLFRAAPYLATRVLGDARAYYPLVGIAPAILVISVVSVFRGYFQGCQLMWPTALSEVMEQLVRVATVFWAALVLLRQGVEYAAAGAAFGAFTGGCAGLLVLVLLFWRLERYTPVSRRRGGAAAATLKRLLAYALPISAGSLVIPLVQAIDTVIIPHRLQVAGFAPHEATALFGQLSGMASTLVFLPAIFTVSLTSSLVPHLASALSRGSRGEVLRRLDTALRLTVLLCLPAAVGMLVLATPLMQLLFADSGAGPVTAWLAPAAFFSSLQQTTSGALQGLGNTWLPVVNLLAGCLVKVLCNYYLTVIPGLGVKGAALGSSLGFALSLCLNNWSLRWLAGYRSGFLYLLKPLLAATIMGVVLCLIYPALQPLGEAAATLGAVLLGGLVYLVALLLVGEIRVRDLGRLFRRR